MSELDYGDFVTIKITKVRFLDEPSHWEAEITNADGEDIGSATAPTFAGISDEVYSMIHGGDKYSDYEINEWTQFDANNKNGKLE